jgi:hypothetical protein
MSSQHTIQPITITAPVELIAYSVGERAKVNKYETNRFIRAIGTWLILKSETTSGVIQEYSQQLPYLLAITQLSTASFYSRINFLVKEGLITKENNQLILASFQDAGNKYYLHNTNNKISFTYDPNGKQQIHYLLSAVEIKHNQELQAQALQRKLDKNPIIKVEQLKLIHECGGDVRKMNDSNYNRECLFALQLQSFEQYRKGSTIHNALHAFRADVNRGVKGIATAMNAKSASTASYLKKKLQQQQICSVTKIEGVTSGVRSRKDKYHYVNWNQLLKQTVWYVCDQMQVLVPITKIVNMAVPLKKVA